MHQRTNNLRKGLAILLALCLAPAAIFAEETPEATAEGSDVAITLQNITAEAVSAATVTVDGAEAAREGFVFTAEAVADGEHEVVLSRAGFVTLTLTLTILGGEVTAVSDEARVEARTAAGFTVNMVAGDVDGNGKVDGRDASDLYAAWRATAEEIERYSLAADLDGNGEVNDLDVSCLYAQWRFGY